MNDVHIKVDETAMIRKPILQLFTDIFDFALQILLGVVARSDARPPGMRAVAGSILSSGNIFPWRFDPKIISTATI